jgi:ADP-ribose pyrophosphatase YjhB (NUDIX family)
MSEQANYYQLMLENNQIRPGARAIISNAARDYYLVENNTLEQGDDFLNFVGGGLEIGETLEECLRREIKEESNAVISSLNYLFLVENMVEYKGHVLHGLGFYFEVIVEQMDLKPKRPGIQFYWYTAGELADLDLRPHVVRDKIADGSYRSIRHLISKDVVNQHSS